MNKRILVTALWIGVLLVGLVSPAQAQATISGVNPAEGTVGSQVTITGSGFGEKHGEVLLGEEKSKVLAWSDTEITFLVDKPQHPDEYAITVLLQGDKKPAEPLMFSGFAIRRPRIVPGDMSLIRDGNTVTILGQFFGDKKGALRVGYLQGEAGVDMVVQDPKILDWSMNTIRFELPEGLTGGFVLAVRSAVGTGLALMHLESGVVGSVAPIPDWGGRESEENASGVYYKDNFYIFSFNYNPGYSDNWRIQASILDPSDWSDVSISPPKHETEVPIQPLVVKDTAGKETLWVFHTGHMWTNNVCCTVVWYSKYYDNGIPGTWDPAGWQAVPNVDIDERCTVAPVYDPRNHRISVYFDRDNQLRWFYSDNFGETWSDDELVGKEVGGVPAKHSFVHAIYWPSDTTTALVASTGQVIAVNNGEYRGSIGHLTDDFWRPYLVDLGGQTALLYQHNTPMMTKLNYPTPDNHETWSWSESIPLVTLPDTGIPLTWYSFPWSPRGAVNQVGDERHLYVFYGVHLSEAYTEESINRWYLHDEGILEEVTPLPVIKPTTFSQVSGGEWHTCGLRGDGVIDCWGNDDGKGRTYKPDGTFQAVSSASWHNCGIKTDGTLYCWGEEDRGRISGRPTGNTFTQVTVGDWHGCALTTGGSVDCWGIQDGGRTDDKAGPFKQVRSGNWHNCAIKTDDTLCCWGINDSGRTVPPAGTFTQIDVADWHGCGVRTNGTVDCWGKPDAGRTDDPPSSMTFKQVTTGNWHNCGIKTDGTLYCWGSDDDRRVSGMPTTGTYTYIDAGDRHTCAVRSDGKVVCWGNNSDWQSLSPF